jgi:hypothetical protein
MEARFNVREEAVKWLDEELQLMNANGAHWVKDHYAQFVSDDEMAMCIKGASNYVLFKRVSALSKFKSKLKDLLGLFDDPTEELVGHNLFEALESSSMLREAAGTEAKPWIKVQDAVEIALNMAMQEKFGKGHKANGPEQGETNITSFNDSEETDWEDIVAVHERAKELVAGRSPLSWETYGRQQLLKS